jgi:hypothetical protein
VPPRPVLSLEHLAHRVDPSSIELGSRRLSLPFSNSNAFGRCASDTFMPPNLAFQT